MISTFTFNNSGTLALTGGNLPVLVESTVPAAPNITSVALSNGTFTLSGTGPTAENFRVFATSDVLQAFANWSQIATGTFSNSTFSVTDATAPSATTRYYRLSVP